VKSTASAEKALSNVPSGGSAKSEVSLTVFSSFYFFAIVSVFVFLMSVKDLL